MEKQPSLSYRFILFDVLQFIGRTVILLAIVLILISGVRAALLIRIIRQAANHEPVNETLADKWSPAYPSLHHTWSDLSPDATRSAILRRGKLENMLLALPDRLIDFILSQTSRHWHPDPQHAGTTAAAHVPARPRPAPPPAPDTPAAPAIPAPPATPPPRATTPPAPNPPPADPHAKWAAVITPTAPIYNANGQRSHTVPAGSVVDIIGEKKTTNGTLFTGTVHSPLGRFDHVGIRAQDLQIYPGKTLRETTRAERELASEQAGLQGAITARKQQIETEHANRNPYQAAYHQNLRRYQALRDEAAQLQPEYENTTGSTRISAGSRLREIRQEMATLTPAIRNLQQQRDAWNGANPQTAAPDPDRDPVIINLRRQLSSLTDNQNW